jgi:hypothetical protein
MAEKGSCGLDSMRDSTGRVVALIATQFLSLGFIRLDNMSMGIPGVFSVINGLSDTSTVVGCCCGGKESVCVFAQCSG